MHFAVLFLLLFQGEILFLRGELSKKNEMLDRERLERCREAGQKEDQVRQAEARRKADVDAAEAEKEFMRQDLRQLQESLRRTEHQVRMDRRKEGS